MLLCFVVALLCACTVTCVTTLLPCFYHLFSYIYSLQLPHPLNFPACTFGFPSVLPQLLCTALSYLCPAVCLSCCSPPYFVALLSSPRCLHTLLASSQPIPLTYLLVYLADLRCCTCPSVLLCLTLSLDLRPYCCWHSYFSALLCPFLLIATCFAHLHPISFPYLLVQLLHHCHFPCPFVCLCLASPFTCVHLAAVSYTLVPCIAHF